MGFYCNGKKGICSCEILCADCTYFNNSGGEEKQTNADRIRAMSDEELADLLGQNCLCSYIQYNHSGFCESRAVCEGCIVGWLKQPAEPPKEKEG